MMNRWFAATLLAVIVPTGGAGAQEGLATSSTIQGHNTIQQAPSGGRVGGAPGVNLPGGTSEGMPTAEEKAIERRNTAATQICKGC